MTELAVSEISDVSAMMIAHVERELAPNLTDELGLAAERLESALAAFRAVLPAH